MRKPIANIYYTRADNTVHISWIQHNILFQEGNCEEFSNFKIHRKELDW